MSDKSVHTIYYDKDIPIKEELLLMVLKMKPTNNKDIDNKGKKKDKSKKNKRGNNVVLVGLFILFLVIFIASGFKVVNWFKDNKDTDKNINQIEEIAEVEEIIDNEENTELINEPDDMESDYWYYINFPLIQVDFNELINKNADTVAWIQVNNTNINYPVVQTSDNDYYLDHSYDKAVNEAGWVFMDYRNNSDLTSKNTIIYAHSRLNKTMFGSLSKVLKSEWYQNKDNHIIKISTPTENSLWQIFSVYKIESESYYITTDFQNDNAYKDFLMTLKNRSKYDFDVTLSESDSILTLSTCYSDTERTVVHAKKIKKSLRDS